MKCLFKKFSLLLLYSRLISRSTIIRRHYRLIFIINIYGSPILPSSTSYNRPPCLSLSLSLSHYFPTHTHFLSLSLSLSTTPAYLAFFALRKLIQSIFHWMEWASNSLNRVFISNSTKVSQQAFVKQALNGDITAASSWTRSVAGL